MEKVISAPATLRLEQQAQFRSLAFESLDGLPVGDGRLVIDLSETRAVDSAGLGALMLVRRHAASRRQNVRLRGISDEIRYLLMLTKLDGLFEIGDPPGA